MTVKKIIGPRNKKPSCTITLSKTKNQQIEYRVNFSYHCDLASYHFYSAQKIDDHYVLASGKMSPATESDHRLMEKIHGVCCNEDEVSVRLEKLARAEFDKLKHEFSHPSISDIEFNKRLHGGKYVPLTTEFIDTLSEEKR